MIRASLSREYRFSAAHRLNSTALSTDENFDVYDKCNNLNGHGHDYRLIVTVSGAPAEQTGMIIPLDTLDAAVHEVIDTLNYKHLNKEIPFFKDKISTAENIIRYLWERLEYVLPKGRLYHLKLWETNNNYFEYGKERAS